MLLVLHNVGQDSTSQEDHVLTTGRILNTDFEVLVDKSHKVEHEHEAFTLLVTNIKKQEKTETYGETLDITLEDLSQVQLLDLLLQTTGKTGVHSRSSRKNDVLVQVRSRIHGCRLDGLEEQLCFKQ